MAAASASSTASHAAAHSLAGTSPKACVIAAFRAATAGDADGLIARFDRLTPQQADSQYRLFMVPGMDHCAGGEGASSFDTLGAIDAWATTGEAPDRIIATRPTAAGGPPGAPAGPPREPLSRPLCPWPQYARYDGSGDPKEAASFACVPANAGVGERG